MWDSAKFIIGPQNDIDFKDYFLGMDFKDHRQSMGFFFFSYFCLPFQISYEEFI